MLREMLADFLDLAARRPAEASDPSNLKTLRKALVRSLDGSVSALTSPNAPETSEIGTILLGANPQSVREPMRIPNPTELVGFCPHLVVLPTGPVGAIAPTLSDLSISIDLNNKSYFTAAYGTTTTTPLTGRDGTFVTLSCIDSQIANRLHCIKLTNPTSELGMTFRWKRGAGVYFDTLITVSVFTRPLPGVEIGNGG